MRDIFFGMNIQTLSLDHIPSTKSDVSENHYKLKKSLLEWLKNRRDQSVCDFISVYYDKRLVETPGGGYEPDVAIVKREEQVWIESETNPLNVFNKLSYLAFLSEFKPIPWPSTLLFGIPPIPPFYKEEYIRTFNCLSPLVRIKVNLYAVDLKKNCVESL